MSTVRSRFDSQLKLLSTSKVTISTATTTAFSFGTPNDINLATTTNSQPGYGYRPGDRLYVVFSATTAGTTNVVSFTILDAPDSSGSIGATATAVTDGTLAGGTGTQYAHTAVAVQPGRPWVRVNVVSNGATDTFVATAQVFAVPQAGL